MGRARGPTTSGTRSSSAVADPREDLDDLGAGDVGRLTQEASALTAAVAGAVERSSTSSLHLVLAGIGSRVKGALAGHVDPDKDLDVGADGAARSGRGPRPVRDRCRGELVDDQVHVAGGRPRKRGAAPDPDDEVDDVLGPTAARPGRAR